MKMRTAHAERDSLLDSGRAQMRRQLPTRLEWDLPTMVALTDIATRATPEDEREWGEEMADRGRATFWRFNPDSNVTRQADSYPGLPPLESAH